MRPRAKNAAVNFLRLAFLACLLVSFSGCAHRTAETIEGPVMVHRPVFDAEGESWVLVQVDGISVQLTDNPRRAGLRLNGQTQEVSGHGGVNTFGGRYDIDYAMLKFSPLFSTKMAGPPELMETERRFFAALERVTGWRREGEVLLLLAGEEIVARFVRQSS